MAATDIVWTGYEYECDDEDRTGFWACHVLTGDTVVADDLRDTMWQDQCQYQGYLEVEA